jgi:DNA-directed RNA polymerase subunit RPC12/RpoP
MDALIFVDTNILLDFYRVRTGGGGLQLLDLIEAHKDILITGSQVEMEYKKNRQRVILEALIAQKTPDWIGLSSPAFLATAKPAKVIARSKKTITTQQAKLKRRIASILENPHLNDPVFKTLSRVFRHDSAYNLSRNKKIRFTVRNLARKRFTLGYPPRKQNETSIGDAVNWEWIIECAKSSGKDIIIVTRDSDYGCNYDGQFHLNDWLRLEFKERISRKRRIVLTDRLAEAFKLVAVPVSAEAEEEEKTIVAERETLKATCGQCGAILDEPMSVDPSLRIACPKCGSKSRRLVEGTLLLG